LRLHEGRGNHEKTHPLDASCCGDRGLDRRGGSRGFGWVATRGLPAVANGDFHRLEHLYGWKTLLPCAKDERAVIDYLTSPRPAFLSRMDEPVELPDAA